MLEMPNSPMMPLHIEASSMVIDALMPTTDMTTAVNISNGSLPIDMKFNAGHQISIIVYRFV